MKFKTFLHFKEKSVKFVNELESWDSFTLISVTKTLGENFSDEYNDVFEEDFNNTLTLNEKGNPLKTLMGLIRLQGLGKILTKAMVDEGAIDLDYGRKLKAAGESDNKEKSQQLRFARDTKKSAAKEKIDGIKEKIDDIAENSESGWVQSLASKIKIEAKIAKSKILLKVANKEEKKELGLQIKSDSERLVDLENELKNYEKEQGKDLKDKAKEESEKIKQDIDSKKEEIKGINDNIKNLNDAALYFLCGLQTTRILRALRLRKWFLFIEDEVEKFLSIMSLNIIVMVLFSK
jgi:hypothetical protein